VASLQFDLEGFQAQLNQMRLICEYSKNLKIKKSSKARVNLCALVVQALNSIGMTATSSRVGLMETLIFMLLDLTTGEEIDDIQDSIRTAIIMLK
jgi:hypothetical protein